MSSMAATLAASLPSLPAAKIATPQAPAPAKVPQRMEGVVDPEASRDIESIQLNSLVRILHLTPPHSTSPPPSHIPLPPNPTSPSLIHCMGNTAEYITSRLGSSKNNETFHRQPSRTSSNIISAR
jgi:hypothetical protein